ncbi:SusC/RagA family TonB-linked outer membrane protein [Pontibacter sp. FD36]|uniref:SusC/RagA family TonB-linked outer membrane protein n=1 Tax=Pontibacter sp. FD36 TaxID=2789860 RepID=UPI0018AA1419|nr:SusC/RagA family TonB-linked outer membrane protein [Pontibacter sp. FD36]MBF8961747.1 SusC/RagA family TonB-linked outer membrane protein [Pontibacter sp. FD36]
MQPKLLIAFLLFCITLPALGQERLQGRVVASPGNHPLPGATVRLLGTNTATATDPEGHFTLAPPPAADTLEISFLGYITQQVPLKPPIHGEMTIALRENSQSLGEVLVSTGYERLAPERVTGSFTQVERELLDRSVSPGILDRLKGVTSGLNFDERVRNNPKVNIRGISTIYGNAEPLIILDNFPYEGSLIAINPNDVESITVLKDAAAASIWGARAGNGVIVITTKKGRLQQPMRVNVNANVSVLQKPDFSQVPMMAPADFIGVERFLFGRGFYNSQENSPARTLLSPAVELMILHRKGQLTDAQLEEALQGLATHDVRDDFQRHLYDTGVNQQYALNLSGGGERMSYYLAGGYDAATGQLGDPNHRISLRADNSYTPTKRLTLHTGINLAQGTRRFGRPAFSDISLDQSKRLYPYARLADEQGNPVVLPRDYRQDYAASAASSGLLNWEYVPLRDADGIDHTIEQQQAIVTVGVDVDLFKGLTFIGKYQYAHNQDLNTNLQTSEAYGTRNLINRFTQVNPDGTLSFPVPRGSIIDTWHGQFRSHNGRGQLRYDLSAGKHELSAMAGAEGQTQRSTGQQFRAYGYDERVGTSVPVDNMTQFPLSFNPAARGRIQNNTGFSERNQRFTSYYANATYTYDSRYVATASARKDASNLFGVNSNQRGVPLWSAGLAWNAHREDFFSLPWLEYLKARTSFGYNGNLDNNLTALATISSVSGNLNGGPYAVVRTYPNPDLRWEKAATWNMGLDFRLKNERLHGTLDYYIKKGTDLIGDALVDPTAGVISSRIRRNVASMKGNGVDLSLTGKVLDRGLNWSSTLLFNYNRSEVTRYEHTTASGSTFINSGLSVTPVEGRPPHSIYSYAWQGLDPQTGDPQGLVEGELSKDYTAITRHTQLEELVYHGPALPPVFGSFLNTFRYKGVTLSGNISYRFGYYFRRPSIHYNNLFQGWVSHPDFAHRWQQPGDEQRTSVPSMVYPNNVNRDTFYANSAALVEKGDHIRLQDINLTVDVLQPSDSWRMVQHVQLYAVARDLGILWRANKHGLDPDHAHYMTPPPTLSMGFRVGF